MNTPVTAPYGAWGSVLTTDMIVAGGLRLGGLVAEGKSVYWTEGRASEGGRNVLMRRDADGTITDLTPAPFNVRTRVHEYGGGAYTIDRGDAWFVNFADQALYFLPLDGEARVLNEGTDLRFADLVVDRRYNRVLCVVEDHTGEGEEANYLGAIDLDSGALTVLASGHDFYSNPCPSPDGTQMAWLTWDHPQMPWDGTELVVANLDEGGLPVSQTVVAGSADIAAFQPLWAPDGELLYVADPNGWWNVFAWRDGETRAVHTGEREFARPQWAFGYRTFGFVEGRDELLCTFCEHGAWRLGWLNTTDGKLTAIDSPLTDIDAFAIAEKVYVIGGTPERLSEVAELDPGTGKVTTIRRSGTTDLGADRISVPTSVTFPTSEGDLAHGYYYAPRNPMCVPPEGERPPLIVIGHGGPTGSTSTTLSPGIQFWTSRGFAVLDVNYRGSTGYGRAYRDRLKLKWGIFDVADCVHGARYLVEQGLADGERLAIRGGSAGGYTALAALTFHDTFTAGASYYGISELEALARDTHKFESRYLDQLIGPYPEGVDVYKARSPINYTDQLSCPVIFFQGLEDKVVPPNQAEMMVAALREKGLPVAYIAFEGEQHGFRAAATIKRTLEAELYFYSRIFGFEPADELEPVDIEGLAS